ncbi:MAG: ERF family protein [Pseudomonadota bacterium]
MTAVTRLTGQQVQGVMTNPKSPDQLVEFAIMGGVGEAAIVALIEEQRRRSDRTLERQEITAFSQLRRSLPDVRKTANGYRDRYQYPELPKIVEAFDPIIVECGYEYAWTTEWDNGFVLVTFNLIHIETGITRRNTLGGKPDSVASSGSNMNGVQRVGASVTYLERYTMLAALGKIADADLDGDPRLNVSHPQVIEGNAPADAGTGITLGVLLDRIKAAGREQLGVIINEVAPQWIEHHTADEETIAAIRDACTDRKKALRAIEAPAARAMPSEPPPGPSDLQLAPAGAEWEGDERQAAEIIAEFQETARTAFVEGGAIALQSQLTSFLAHPALFPADHHALRAIAAEVGGAS